MTYKHELKIRVYYQDTDAHGIVYHANYLPFAERSRQEYFRARGIELGRLFDDHNLRVVMRHCEIDFLASARIDNELTTQTWICEINRTSLVMQTDTYLKDKLINSVKVVLVIINADSKATRIPEHFLKAVS